jgi:hypothetical protein
MALRATNTFSEGLQKLLQEIAGLHVLPDADMEFLAQLQQMVVGKMREPIDQQTSQGLSQVPGNPGMMPPPMGGGMPPMGAGPMSGGMPPGGGMDAMLGMAGGGTPPGGGMGPGIPGLRQESAAPSADALQRLLGSRAGA